MKEWKQIKGFEHYEISNYGEVRNCEGKILKASKAGAGYSKVNLWKDGEKKQKYIHRLVAEAFVPKPEKNVEVNHKDGDKNNNAVENLEWCSRSENLMHSCYVLEKHVKKVRCIETGVVYPSIKAAARHTGFHHTAISLCCDGRQKKTHGTHWEYA